MLDMNWRAIFISRFYFCSRINLVVVGGILPSLAEDLNVSLATAGQLITVFAIVYAISAPVLLTATAKN